MKFNDHSRLEGAHAFLSASKYHWVNYDDAKLIESYRTAQAAAIGTRLHAMAAEHIRLGMRMPRNKVTFNAYVNDAIGYRMTPEQVLYYSPNVYGTADAIRFYENSRFLRIHDLKTGTTRVSMTQLKIYAALFCLEYDVRPGDISAELRIYQNDEVMIEEPDVDELGHIIDKIVHFNKLIEDIKLEDA